MEPDKIFCGYCIDKMMEHIPNETDAKCIVYGIFALIVLVGTIVGCSMFEGNEYYVEDEEHVDVATPAPTTSSTPSIYIPVPSIYLPTPVHTPKIHISSHADGDPRECGTCHTYPSYDENNIPQTPSFIPKPVHTAVPTAIPTHRSSAYTYTISSSSPIPNDYYSQDCELPTDQSMQEYLANSEWIDDYDAGGWDCSQMAAYMEFMLENCGYNVVIRAADVEGEEYGHAWILVEFQEGMLAYECTTRHWVYPSEALARSYEPFSYVYWSPSMYDAGVRYESIYDIWNDYKQYSNGEEAFLQEYGWWIE